MALKGPLGAIERMFRIKVQHEHAARRTRQRGLKIYERALVIAVRYCCCFRIIAAIRPNEVRRSDYSQAASGRS